MSSTEGIDPTPPPTGSAGRRGFRFVVGLLAIVMVFAGIGMVGRVLAPEPTDDPCAAVPSGPVEDFFPEEHEATPIRMTLPGSSRQRCVWVPRAGNDLDFSTYRRVEVTFGLADRDAYLDRMRDHADRAADQQDPRMVEIDDSDDHRNEYRLATVQRGRTDGEHDIVVELSATAGTNGPRPQELRELLSTLAEQLRPLRETALHQSADSDQWMLTGPDGAPVEQLLSNGFTLADPAECARVPSDLLHDILGEHSRAPIEAGCVWQSEPEGSQYETVFVRLGTADDPITARDAYAELSFTTDGSGHVVADRYRTDAGELGDGVRSRVLVGTLSLPGSTAMADARIAEVTATDGRSVVAVEYVASDASRGGAGQQTPSSERAERAALELAKALLIRP